MNAKKFVVWSAALSMILGMFVTGIAHGQVVVAQYVEAPALVPITPFVAQPVFVQPAPYVVQRPTIIPRPVPVVAYYAPAVAAPVPVVTQRVPIETTVVARPYTGTQTVWYSAPADLAPTLATTPVGQTVIASSPVPVSPVIVGVAPSVVYRPVVTAVPIQTNYYIGAGSLGQPKVYVQGQPLRNTVRYLSP